MQKKTILVVYTDTKLNTKQIGAKKRYCFVTASEVEVGDMIEFSNYDTPMQVVEVIDQEFKYYNSATGDMTNELTSTNQWKIREIVLMEGSEEETIVAIKLKK